MSIKEKNSDSDQPSAEEPESKYRIYSIISYFLVLIVLGIPVWWYTTRVYRANLPLDEIYNLEFKNESNRDFGIPLSLEYDILISFVHVEPENLKIELSGQEIDNHLQAFIKKLSPVADFVVKSQWLYQTELGAIPRKINDYFVLLENQLPHVITPLETKLWSHMSLRPSLSLVIYFPHCRSPLHIYDNNNQLSNSNAFVSPRWGGIYILNADKKSCQAGLFKPKLENIIATFEAMIQELFNMKDASDSSLEKLKVRKTEEMLDSSRRTLKSLAELLSEINSIVISDEVADKINVAVQSVKKSQMLLKNGKVDEALGEAKIAFNNSEEAFSHHSLLALLYFPDDQKYAIYIPLFLPVMIPVVMSLTTIKRKLRKEKSD